MYIIKSFILAGNSPMANDSKHCWLIDIDKSPK